MTGARWTSDRSLLLEILLGIGLVVSAVVFYWIPASEGELTPRWWHWLIPAALFFALVALHTWRAKRRSNRALHRAIQEEAARLEEDEEDVGATGRPR